MLDADATAWCMRKAAAAPTCCLTAGTKTSRRGEGLLVKAAVTAADRRRMLNRIEEKDNEDRSVGVAVRLEERSSSAGEPRVNVGGYVRNSDRTVTKIMLSPGACHTK